MPPTVLANCASSPPATEAARWTSTSTPSNAASRVCARAQVGANHLHGSGPAERLDARRRADQRAHPVPAREQGGDDVPPEEAVRSGDQDLHAKSLTRLERGHQPIHLQDLLQGNGQLRARGERPVGAPEQREETLVGAGTALELAQQRSHAARRMVLPSSSPLRSGRSGLGAERTRSKVSRVSNRFALACIRSPWTRSQKASGCELALKTSSAVPRSASTRARNSS